MVSKATSETHRAHRRPPVHAASATPRKRRAKEGETNHIGRMIGLGALIVLGAVVVLGVGSVAALLAGYEPAGHEAQARRLRRFARDHGRDFSHAVDALEPVVGRQIGRGERWVRDRIAAAR